LDKEEAYNFTRSAAKEEGIFVGVSSGASLAAVAKKLPELGSWCAGILTFCYDTGERYLSIDDLFQIL
jgi:cysteine synthase